MDDEKLRCEIAAELLHAIRFAMSLNADLSDLSNSQIVRTIAALEAERRRTAERPKATAPSLFRPRFRKLNC